MTIPASSVPAVRAALVAGITTQVNDTTVLVSNGMPPAQNQPDDIVAVGGVRRDLVHNAFVGSGGAGWLQEQYRVEVVTGVYRGGDNFASADTRAWAINDAVEQFVRNDPSLGGLDLVAKPETSDALVQWDDDHKGVIVQITTQILVKTQL